MENKNRSGAGRALHLRADARVRLVRYDGVVGKTIEAMKFIARYYERVPYDKFVICQPRE